PRADRPPRRRAHPLRPGLRLGPGLLEQVDHDRVVPGANPLREAAEVVAFVAVAFGPVHLRAGQFAEALDPLGAAQPAGDQDPLAGVLRAERFLAALLLVLPPLDQRFALLPGEPHGFDGVREPRGQGGSGAVPGRRLRPHAHRPLRRLARVRQVAGVQRLARELDEHLRRGLVLALADQPVRDAVVQPLALAAPERAARACEAFARLLYAVQLDQIADDARCLAGEVVVAVCTAAGRGELQQRLGHDAVAQAQRVAALIQERVRPRGII